VRFIRKLSLDKNINKRRAALVFLTVPIRYSEDKRLAALAFEVIEKLKPERHIMITKAVSWLLRSMVRHHQRAVAAYVRENRHSLPAIAVRETTRKIHDGPEVGSYLGEEGLACDVVVAHGAGEAGAL